MMPTQFADVLLWLRGSGLRILVIIATGILVIRLLRVVADRIPRLMPAGTEPVITEREKRARTAASLLRTVGTTVVLVICAMMVLREIGLDITPLVAGAGVAGLAIGFGAQSLVRDVIGGFFILLEDQFHVGDVIQAAGVAGQVEQMNLRVTVIRDLQGTVHFIPNGEIKVVSNLTKEWSRAVLEVGISHEEDVDRVIAVLAEVGRSLNDNETFGKLLLEPPQVLGIESVTESQVTIRLLAKTVPFKQWEVARELRRCIKLRFDQEG
ncbi:MAG TPA: mechanosensitive ion channel family protein, partial [Candidatus Methylomirabilis sp.]|nr:mechanosensitive ion channel family protein [Candidatus Methylomirabilis sp.]